VLFVLVFCSADKTTRSISEKWEEAVRRFGSKTSEYAGERGGCVLLATAALQNRSCGLGCERLIIQLVPVMLVLKNIFSKEQNLYTRSLALDCCDQAGTRA